MKKHVLRYHTQSFRLVLSLVLLFYAITASAQAPSPTFYTGNVNAPSNSFPFNNAAGKAMQSLIAPGEFTGAQFGNITKFYVQGDANSSATWSNLVIRMGQTTATTLPTAALYTGQLDTVLFVPMAAGTSTAAGWMQFNLQRPFLYDPTKSLVVEISQCASTGSFTVTNVSKAGSFRRMWNNSTCAMAYSGQDANLFNCGVDMSSASNNDVGASLMTSPGLFCTPGTLPVEVQVKNYGVNQVNNLTVNWSVDGVLQTPVNFNSLLDTFGGAGSTTAIVPLGSYNFPATPITIKVWTSSPNNLSDTIPQNDTVQGVYRPSLHGAYTIDPAGSGLNNFLTIDAAVNALAVSGVCAPVTFAIANGSYQRTSTLTIPAIPGASGTNTITFYGNGSSVCTIYGAVASAAVINLNNAKFVTLRDISVINTSTTSPCGIAGVGITQNVTIKKCYVKVPVVGTTSATGYGINFTGNSAGTSVSACLADSITIDSNVIVGGGYGITVYGASTATANRGIVITNNLVDSVNYMGGYIAYNYNPIVFSRNTINMNGSTYSYYGVYFYYNRSSELTQSHIITRNRINNFGYYGFYIASPTNIAGAAKVIINNNIVVSTSTGTTYAGAFGIYLTQAFASSAADVYHNTVVMQGPTTASNPAAFYNGTSTETKVKNNIFAVYTNVHVPVYLAASLSSGNLNNNLYYNSSTTNILVYRGGTYYTPANFQTLSAGGDSSVSTAPPFVSSPSLLKAADLRLSRACLEGTNLGGDVPRDYSGTTRAAIPTLGAYEFVNTTTDNLAMMDVITPALPIVMGMQDLKFRVRNVGTNAINFYNVSYKHNGGFPYTLYKTVTLAPCAIDTADFNGSYQINLTTVNDIVMYTESPNGMPDGAPVNDTLKLKLESPLNGNYTIGGSGANFTTPQLAAAALKSGGVTGPVTFTFNPGTYTGQLLIQGPIAGNTDVNPIVFDGLNAAATTITANVAQSAIVISDAKYITVKNLTVTNTNATAGAGGIAVVGNIFSTYGSSCTISKNIVNLPNLTSTQSYGIIVTGTANGAGASNNNVDSVIIDSNVINGGNYGIEVYGNTTTPSALINRGHKVRYNTINNAYNMGAHVYYIYNPVDVIGNVINMHTTTTAASYGLYFYYCQNNSAGTPHRINNNKIVNANTYGFYAYYFASPSASPMQVYNNVISGTSRSTSFSAAYLYSAAANANVNVYHNTFIANTTVSFPSLYGLNYYNTTGSVQNIKNNIFGIQATLAGSNHAPAYFQNVGATNVNYNNYYNLSSSNMVYKNNTFYNTSNYKVVSIGGDSSFNRNPGFANLLTPVLTEGCTRGTDLTADVPLDNTGAARSTSPNVGAYEYAGIGNDVSLETMLYPVSPVNLGAQDLAVRVRNNGNNVITSFSVSYVLNTNFPITYNWSGALNPCDTVTVVFNGANQIMLVSGTNNVKVYTDNPNYLPDGQPGNDTIKVNFETPLNGLYTIGAAPSDFTTFTAAIAALDGRGVSGPVVFQVKTATYTESINLGGVAGASAVNSITFTSVANNADSVTLAWTSTAASAPYVVRFKSEANYYKFDKITLSQLSASAAYYTVILQGAASFDSITNCVIKQPANSSYTSSNIYGAPYSGEGLIINNNSIRGAYYGVYLNGGNRVTGMKNMVFNANTITDYYSSPFYYLYNTRGTRFTNNTITASAASSTGQYLYFYYNDSGFINRNNVFNTATGKTVYWYGYYSANDNAKRSVIANNQIRGAGSAYFYVGNTTSNQDIVHNSFYMNSGYFYVTVASISNMRVLNNVFNSAGTYAYYFSAAPSSVTLTSDYNSVFTTGSTTPYYATAARTASAFKAAYFGLETNTMNVAPGLTSATNLAPDATNVSTWSLNGRGTYIGYPIRDVNNVSRPQTFIDGTPDIGAFEFTPTVTPAALTAIPASPVAGGTQVFMYNDDTAATINWDASAPVPASITGRLYSGVYPPGMTGTSHAALNMYWDFTASAGSYYYNVNLYYKPNMRGSIPVLMEMIGTKKSGANPWAFFHTPQSVVDSARSVLTITNLSDFSIFTGTDPHNPLPVKLSSIDAVAQHNNVLVSWVTASEKNSSYFEVYASHDGKNFSLVSERIKAKGNSSTAVAYQFTDMNAFVSAKTVYYRLKTVDMNGSFEWSKVVKVTKADEATPAISVYPNPNNGLLNIALPASGTATIEIISLQGERLMSTSVNTDSQETIQTRISHLNTGIYFVKVTQNGVTYTQKIVKN